MHSSKLGTRQSLTLYLLPWLAHAFYLAWLPLLVEWMSHWCWGACGVKIAGRTVMTMCRREGVAVWFSHCLGPGLLIMPSTGSELLHLVYLIYVLVVA